MVAWIAFKPAKSPSLARVKTLYRNRNLRSYIDQSYVLLGDLEGIDDTVLSDFFRDVSESQT